MTMMKVAEDKWGLFFGLKKKKFSLKKKQNHLLEAKKEKEKKTFSESQKQLSKKTQNGLT